MVDNKTTLWCDRVMVFSFCALIYFIPISTALIESFSGVILTAYFVKRCVYYYFNLKTREVVSLTNPVLKYGRTFIRSFKPVSSHLSWPIGMFILACFLSVIFSQYPAEGIKGFVTKLIQGTFLFFSFLECIKTKKQLKVFLTFYCLAVTLVVINGFVQYFTGQGFIHGRLLWKGRIDSTFRHANDFAAYLVMVIPALFWLFVSYHGKRDSTISLNPLWEKVKNFFCLHTKWLLLLLFILSLISLGLTFSRGAWLAFILGILYMCSYRRKTLVVGVLVVSLFIGIFYPLMKAKRRVNFMTDVMPKEFNYEAALENLKEQIKSEERKYEVALSDIKTELARIERQYQESLENIKDFKENLKQEQNHINVRTQMKRMEGLEKQKIFIGLAEKDEPWDFAQGDFTIDYWYYPRSLLDNQAHFSLMNNIGNCLVVRLNGVNYLDFAYWENGRNLWGNNFEHGFKQKEWHHIAVVRHGSDIRMFINGKEQFHITIPQDTQLRYDFLSLGFWSIGTNNYGFLDGFIANFRIRKGKAVWNKDFPINNVLNELDIKKRNAPGVSINTAKRVVSDGSWYDINSVSKKQVIVLHNQELSGDIASKFEDFFLDVIYSRIETDSIEKIVEAKMEARMNTIKMTEKAIEKQEKLIEEAKKKGDYSWLLPEGYQQDNQQEVPFSFANIIKALKNFGGSGRKGYWKEAFNMIKDYPLFGVGLNAYSSAVDKYKITWGGYPHNCYLQMAAETGLVGLATFLWMLIMFFRQAIKDSFNVRDKTLHAVLIGFAGGVFAFMCHCFVDTNLYSTQLGNLAWVVFGIVVVAPQLDSNQQAINS